MLTKNSKKIAVVAAVVQAFAFVGAVLPTGAEAAQITDRSLALSSSTPGGTSVTYTFTFTPATAGNVGAIGFEFCSEDPLQGTTCTKPTGMVTTGGSLVSVDGQGASNGGFTLTATTDGYPYLTRTPAAITTGVTTVKISGITNPSATTSTTHYLRLLTFSTATPGTTVDETADNSAVDFGGVAWATNPGMNVTAKVQETLNFCTYTGANCGAGGAAVNLGILSTSVLSAASSKIDLGTNAKRGATVQYYGDTLKSGSNPIAAKTTKGALTAGTANFGINLAANTTASNLKNADGTAYTSSGPTGTGTLGTVTANYSSDGQFLYNVQASAATPDLTPGTPGANTVATATAPIDRTTYTATYGAAIANTTASGIYTTTVSYVATGLF